MEEGLARKLDSAIEWSAAKSRQLLQEVMVIERVLNNVRDTKPIVRVKEVEKMSQQKLDEELDTAKYQKKYEEMMTTAE